jgi:hypothetical protein
VIDETPDLLTRLAHAYDPAAFEDHPVETRFLSAALQWGARRKLATDAAQRLLPFVEALQADFEDADAYAKANAMNMTDWIAMRVERDALKAQLASMTVETRKPGLSSGLPLREQRLVGPWTVVPEGPTDPEPYVHPQHGRAAVPHTGTGWQFNPRTVVPEDTK